MAQELFGTFLRKFVGNHQGLLATADQYAGTLDRASLAYAELLNPQLPDAFKAMAQSDPERLAVAGTARRFGRVRASATFLPILIAARLRYPTDGQHYIRLLDACEVFAFRAYRLLGKYANSGQSSFYRLANDVWLDKKDPAATLEAIRGLTTYYSPPAEFDAALSIERTRAWYPWYGLKYLLYECETHLAGKKGATAHMGEDRATRSREIDRAHPSADANRPVLDASVLRVGPDTPNARSRQPRPD